MKKLLLIGMAFIASQSAMSQDFVYTAEQHIVADVQNLNYEAYYIDINTQTPQAIQYEYELISNTLPVAWSYNLCDYTNCHGTVPANATMTAISLSEAQDGVHAYFHLNLTTGTNYGQGILQIYVYDVSDYTIGDTVSWDITASMDASIDDLEELDANIFPNPVVDFLTLELSSPESVSSIRIIGVDGKEYYSQPHSSAIIKIDLSTFPSGMYYVELIGENGIKTTMKVIKS